MVPLVKRTKMKQASEDSKLCLTGRYMSLALFRHRREYAYSGPLSGQRVRPAPAPRGPILVSRFCQRENKTTNA
jgi:hypothetical protein